MLPEISEPVLHALTLRSNWLASVAEQVEHLPLPKLQKTKFNIALLVSLFIFFIEIGESKDKEDARIGRQSD